MWRVIPALLFAPLLVLGELQLAYALVTPSCERQAGAWLHLPALVSLLISAWFTWLAWAESQRLAHASDAAPSADADHHGAWKLFLARTAAGIGLLATATQLAMWIPHWGLGPCLH
jgi:hypothetical protein